MKIKIFAFSFWEAILRRENSIPLKYHVTFVQNLHQPKNLVHCFNWINLSMFLTFPVSSKIWHSWNTECEWAQFFNESEYRKWKWKFEISHFHFNQDVLKLLSQWLIVNYVTFRFDDIVIISQCLLMTSHLNKTQNRRECHIYGTRGRFRQRARSLTLLSGCAGAFERSQTAQC